MGDMGKQYSSTCNKRLKTVRRDLAYLCVPGQPRTLLEYVVCVGRAIDVWIDDAIQLTAANVTSNCRDFICMQFSVFWLKLSVE